MKTKAIKIIKKLQENGFQAVFAGGYVRDMVLKKDSHDIDIATNALPDDVERLFSKTIPVGKAFGVIIVVMDGTEFEVATFRNDSYIKIPKNNPEHNDPTKYRVVEYESYNDGRHPDSVSFSTMEEDAKRRDLTINGMFYDPINDVIHDFVGGQKDINNGVIRLIGNPDDRIAEDKLRMLRVVRFAARFGFEMEETTLNAVIRHSKEISQVSVERIAMEYTKILCTGMYRRAFELLFKTGLVDYTIPELRKLEGCEQPPQFHPEGDCYQHTILALEHLPDDSSEELRWATLLHDIGKPATQTFEDRIRFNGHDMAGVRITESLMKRLKFSNYFVERVTALIGSHMRFMHIRRFRVSKLKRFIRMPHFDEHMELHRADCLSSHGGLDNYDFAMEKINFFGEDEVRPERLITGNDLLDLGFKAGPIFKEILTAVEDKQLEDVLKTRDDAIEFVKNRFVLKKKDVLVNGNDLKRLGFRPSPLFKKIMHDVEERRRLGQFDTKEDAIKFVRKEYDV